MPLGLIIKYLLISAVIVFYFIFTTRYYFAFKKNIIFTGKVKVLHLVLIWLIPFIWIFILKSLTKVTPGSYQVENKGNSKPFSDDDDANRASNMGF